MNRVYVIVFYFRKQAPEARPCAFYIKKHLEELEKELQLTSNESYRQSQMSWRQDCDYVEYEFDIDEIKQWSRDLECYRQLQMRYTVRRLLFCELDSFDALMIKQRGISLFDLFKGTPTHRIMYKCVFRRGTQMTLYPFSNLQFVKKSPTLLLWLFLKQQFIQVQ